jgi:hypothetical protein
MSFVLNGTSQYGYVQKCQYRDYPITLAAWFKPLGAGGEGGIFSFDQTGSNVNLLVAYRTSLNGRALTNDQSGNAQTSGNPITLGAWNTIVCVWESATNRHVYINGGSKASNTTNASFPSVDNMTVGAVRFAAGFGIHFNGSIAHACAFNRAWSDANTVAFHGGQNPLAFSGCLHYYPLLEDGVDAQGSADLTLVASPTFDANDHPAVSIWPPESGSSISRYGIRSGGLL